MTNYIVNMLTAIKIKHMKLSFLFLLILCSCSNTPQKNMDGLLGNGSKMHYIRIKHPLQFMKLLTKEFSCHGHY